MDSLDHELEPDNAEQVVILSFLLDFAHESEVEGRKKELDDGVILRFLMLYVEKELIITESLCGRNIRVARVAFDNVCHCRGVLGDREERNGVHSTIVEMVRNHILNVNMTSGLLHKKSRRANTTDNVVPLLGGAGMNRTELVWKRDVIGGARIVAGPTRIWLAASPSKPIIPGKGRSVANNEFIGPIGGNDRIGDRWHRRGGDRVRSWCLRCHLGEMGRRAWKGVEWD